MVKYKVCDLIRVKPFYVDNFELEKCKLHEFFDNYTNFRG